MNLTKQRCYRLNMWHFGGELHLPDHPSSPVIQRYLGNLEHSSEGKAFESLAQAPAGQAAFFGQTIQDLLSDWFPSHLNYN